MLPFLNERTDNLLDYLYYQNFCKRVANDLSRRKIQAFFNKLEKKWRKNVFIAEKQQKYVLNFSVDY